MSTAVPTTSKTGFTAYMEVLGHYLEASGAKDEQFGLILVDLDNLRRTNTSMGYEAGRQMLVEAARRLEAVCRPRDRVIQYSDQGFALLLTGMHNQEHAELAANKIWREFAEHVDILGHRMVIEVSMGIALFPMHGRDAQSLMQAAEAAQFSASSTMHWQVYTPSVTEEATGLVGIESELDEAITQGQLEMHYQPKLQLPDCTPTGVEALMRWFHPTRGPVRPDIFIDMAERIGKMEDLTWFALNSSLRQLRDWPLAGRPFNVAINVTPGIVQKEDFAEIVCNALQVWDVDPGQLTIEVTETALMKKPEASFRTLARLRDKGVRISIDDFGTGYSSLAYFKNIPATELKIDRSFVFRMLENPGDRKIVQTVIDLAHNFGLKVVAEGIENEETNAALVAMGCDIAQGYYHAKPMNHEALSRWLTDYTTPKPVRIAADA